MGRPSLGKGMKDLLSKNFGLAEDKERGKDKAPEELELNISRYEAQGFDTGMLRDLSGKPPEEMMRGIEEYRTAVKALLGAQTVLRSLEGHGYSTDIEIISQNIKNPRMLERILREVDALKERAVADNVIRLEKKEPVKVKLPESLKAASTRLKTPQEEPSRATGEAEAARKPAGTQEVVDMNALDSLLDDLSEIGEAFNVPAETQDPLLEKIFKWEGEGYFVDRLKTALAESRDLAEVEVKRFEEELSEMVLLKERFAKLDLTGFEKEAREVQMRFPYPHLASEVRNELDRIEALIAGTAPAERPIVEERPPAPPEPEPVREEQPSEAVIPEKAPAPQPIPPPRSEAPPVPAPKKEAPARQPVELPSEIISLSAEQLMDRAKEAYSSGELNEAVALFEVVLRKDPENSKARFMIRRIGDRV